MTMIECKTTRAGELEQRVAVRTHTFAVDGSVAAGGADAAPNPHDYFDAALAACKAVTATMYAEHKGIPLERGEGECESDATHEREGRYAYRVKLTWIGANLTDEQRAGLHRAAKACPISKLMTTSEITIETIE